MPKKITKLTKKQEAMFPVWVEKWVKIGLQTGETDWDTFDKFFPVCYEKAGLQYPKNIVRVHSPLVGRIASSIADSIINHQEAVHSAVGSAVGSAVDSAVNSAVNSAVRSAVDSVVNSAVGSAVHSAVGSAVNSAVDSAVRSAVGSAVGSAVNSAVNSAVRSAVDSVVNSAVGSAVHSAVGSAVNSAVRSAVDSVVHSLPWHYWLAGQFWVGGWWGASAYISFFTDVCGLKLNKDIIERATAYRKVCESVNYIWPNKHFVMVCARPSQICIVDNRLHCLTGKAIQYPDGWGIYAINGIVFPEKLYLDLIAKKLSFEDILKIEDVDQRNQAMRFVGDRERIKFLEHVKAEIIDTYKKISLDGKEINYKLYKIKQGEVFNEDTYIMWYECPSTGLNNMSGVPESKTVAESMAWKGSNDQYKITPAMWELAIPLTDES